jgi:hypothetical protein
LSLVTCHFSTILSLPNDDPVHLVTAFAIREAKLDASAKIDIVEVDGISLDTTSWLPGEGELSNSLLSLPAVAGEDFRS